MKKILVLAVLAAFNFNCAAQQQINRDDVLAKMELANAYFMKKWPDVGKTIITNKERPSNIWTRGVYYEGLMALHEIYPKKEYYQCCHQYR